MERIYAGGMTTTSGGNLSVRDPEGDVWVTPTGIDKGHLAPADIVCLRDGCVVEGQHRPTSEYLFHLAIYERRPDIQAIVHAHPPALAAFGIVQKTPDTRVTPDSYWICGPVGCAPYALTGSEELAGRIADAFGQGFDSVLMENHGVVTAGDDLLHAFHRFEALEYCARTIISASALGPVRALGEDEIPETGLADMASMESASSSCAPGESTVRERLRDVVRRAHAQHLMPSTAGAVSARLEGGMDSFLITPHRQDWTYLEVDDLVRIEDGLCERGKVPGRSVRLHRAIYQTHPDVGAIVHAHAPYVTAYAVVGRTLDARHLSESYVILREAPLLPYGPQFDDEARVATALSSGTRALLLQNDGILTTGPGLIEAFDCLEVAEFTAMALFGAVHVGVPVPITEDDVRVLDERFPR